MIYLLRDDIRQKIQDGKPPVRPDTPRCGAGFAPLWRLPPFLDATSPPLPRPCRETANPSQPSQPGGPQYAISSAPRRPSPAPRASRRGRPTLPSPLLMAAPCGLRQEAPANVIAARFRDQHRTRLSRPREVVHITRNLAGRGSTMSHSSRVSLRWAQEYPCCHS